MSGYFLKSKVREYIKAKGLKTSKDVTHGKKLDGKIENLLSEAVDRAKASGRKTLMERDL